jgi:hypothetical protein
MVVCSNGRPRAQGQLRMIDRQTCLTLSVEALVLVSYVFIDDFRLLDALI